jgi:internalin A
MKRLSMILWVVIGMSLIWTGCGGGSATTTTKPAVTKPATTTTRQSTAATTTATNEEVVIFKCPELESLVRVELKIESDPITSTDMLELKRIRPNGKSVTSLVGLEYAKNLQDFGILNNKVELASLEPISQLSSLERILVSYTKVSEPVRFGKLEKVTYLNFTDTTFSDISSLVNLPAIQDLTLSSCGISDIRALSGMKDLNNVYLRSNKITSIDALRGKGKIESLNIQHNQVSDISPMADMISLKDAILSYNPITNLKPLENLPNLKELVIYQDHDVKHLIFDQIAVLQAKGIEVSYHQ